MESRLGRQPESSGRTADHKSQYLQYVCHSTIVDATTNPKHNRPWFVPGCGSVDGAGTCMSVLVLLLYLEDHGFTTNTTSSSPNNQDFSYQHVYGTVSWHSKPQPPKDYCPIKTERWSVPSVKLSKTSL